VVCTELAVRTAIGSAGIANRLVVGDAGSTDGSIEMLKAFRDRGLLELQLPGDGRHHSEWLDTWLASCPTRWAVFVDSDVEFHRDRWLWEMVEIAQHGFALVCAEMLPAVPHTIEPVGDKEVYLAPRPAPWLLLVDCARLRSLESSFRFVAEPSTDRPEGVIAYDTGAKLFATLLDADVPWCQMSASFRGAYTHYGNMSWADKFGAGRAHRAKLRRVRRHLRRARRKDPG
jgi:hypothetical protein